MSHFTALLENGGRSGPSFIARFRDSFPFATMLVSSLPLPRLFQRQNVCSLPPSALTISRSFLFAELVHLIQMQPSGRNKGAILDSLHSYRKYQGYVWTRRKSSGSCLQLVVHQAVMYVRIGGWWEKTLLQKEIFKEYWTVFVIFSAQQRWQSDVTAILQQRRSTRSW